MVSEEFDEGLIKKPASPPFSRSAMLFEVPLRKNRPGLPIVCQLAVTVFAGHLARLEADFL